MSSSAIEVRDLAKQYRIGAREPYKTLRESLVDLALGPARALARFAYRRRKEEPTIWALDGVSFDVAEGEVVGIIGRNGAGKSTLLKILSRITHPTRGEALLRGRVGALLEVGTGFHPELTGRENIFLMGAVLGMKRSDVLRRFDEIVQFAEVESFLDTPVKHYSSGMFMRLAFSVAGHLEPDILIVDEVLAVGDAAFQRKCLNRMETLGKQGRTVLFVSHDMPALTRLCSRAILLDGGRFVMDGPAHEVVAAYLRSGLGTAAAREWPDLASAPGNDKVRLRAVRVRSSAGDIAVAVDIRRPVALELEFDVLLSGHRLVPNLHVFNEDGICAFVTSEVDSPWHLRPRTCGRYVARVTVPGNFLAEGTHIVTVLISTMDPVAVHVRERDAVAFQVVDSLDGDSARGDYGGPFPGVVRPLLKWETIVSPEVAGGGTET
jgi:lipopolysaccharide transport system ATP-binding protein